MASPPRLVILGLDFFSFDDDLDVESYSSRFRSHNYQNEPLLLRVMQNTDLLLSKDAIKENLASLRENNLDFKQFSKESFHDASGKRSDISLLDDTYSKALQLQSVINPGGHGYHKFKFSDKKLDGLIQVISKMKDQGISIKLFLTPLHVYFMEAIFQLDLFPQYRKIIISMSNISKDRLIEFYDFSGYNNVTKGVKGINVTGHYADAGHYSYQIGNRILETIFHQTGDEEESFGKLVTNDNLENHLTNYEQQRLKWRRQNQRDAAIIDAIINPENKPLSKNGLMQIVIKGFYESPGTHYNNLPPMTKHDAYRKIQYCDKNHSMAYVDSGEFLMGALPEESIKNSLPIHKVRLGGFCIDVHEVTNIDFYNAGMKPVRKVPDKHNNDNQPAVNLTFREAQQFCHKKRKRLPTEQEWEKAARGTDARRFPWGNYWPDCQLANFNGSLGSGCGQETTKNVGSKINGASPYGVFDLAGNVFEYVNISAPNYDSLNYYIHPPLNDQLIKGGGWSSEFQHLPVSYRRYVGVHFSNSNIGFRCAKDFNREEEKNVY